MLRYFIAYLLFTSSIAEEMIKYAAVIYRHGDRTPVDTYPTDPYRNESLWPEKFGELTNIGKQQHYALGKWLRQRYLHMLSIRFDPAEIKVRSTDVDRTLMSAQANLAGMYPPVGNSVWNKDLMWQPIPIHTVPESEDEVLAMKKNCTAYNKERERYINTKEYKDRLNKYKPLMNYLSAYTGQQIKDYYDILNIYSTLKIEQLYNFTLPNWTASVFPDKMREPSCYSFSTLDATPILARYHIGPLLKDIMSNVKHVLSPKNDQHKKLKVSIYSGHDLTIGSILTGLGVFDENCPVYTATIFFELIYDNARSEHFIRISYRNSTEIVEPHVLHIPYCGEMCPVARFHQLYKNLLTVNFDEECNSQRMSTTMGMSFLLGAIFIIGVFVAFKIRSNPKTTNTQRKSHHIYTNFNSSGKVVFV